jgi:hypothetical protein
MLCRLGGILTTPLFVKSGKMLKKLDISYKILTTRFVYQFLNCLVAKGTFVQYRLV